MKVGHFKVSWRYNGPEITKPIIKKGKVVGVKQGIDRVETTCVIMDLDSPIKVKEGEKEVDSFKIIAKGVATRSIHDRPCSNKARIVSLAKALHKLYPSQQDTDVLAPERFQKNKLSRTQFWSAYSELSPKRAWKIQKRQEKALE